MDRKYVSFGYWAALILTVIIFAAAAGWLAWGVPVYAPGTEHIVPMAKPGQPTNREMLSGAGGVGVASQDVAYYGSVIGFYAHPDKPGRYPGVVMMHEWWGLNDNIKGMARALASNGYQVLAVDLFGKTTASSEDAAKLVAGLDQAKADANMEAAVSFLRGRGATKVASLGWCFGGGQSLQLALVEPLDAVVIYYGFLVTDEKALEPLKGEPVLGIFGDKDQAVHVEDVRKFAAALDKLGVDNEIHIYPNVGHAFANPSGPTYAPNETKDAWQKTLDFLAKKIKQ